LRVDDADVAGAVFRLLGHGGKAGLQAVRASRSGELHRPGADQLSAPGQVVGREQAQPGAGRGRDEVGVGDILRPIREGEARRLGVVVQPVGAGQSVLSQRQGCSRGPLQQAQDLADRQRPRARRRKTADPVGLARWHRMVEAQRLALAWLVAGQVGQAEPARVAWVRSHLVDQGLGHRSLVQGLRALGRDVLQQPGQLGILQPMADRPGLALAVVEVGGGDWVLPEVRVSGQQLVEPRTDPKALFGQLDGRLEQAGPGQLAMLPVRQLQHAQAARHADRAAADHGVGEGHRLAVGPEEQPLVGFGRRGLAAIKGLDRAAIEMQQECAAADAAGLGLDQGQHHLHRDGGVQRAAAGPDDLVAGLGGQRVGCRHGKA